MHQVMHTQHTSLGTVFAPQICRLGLRSREAIMHEVPHISSPQRRPRPGHYLMSELEARPPTLANTSAFSMASITKTLYPRRTSMPSRCHGRSKGQHARLIQRRKADPAGTYAGTAAPQAGEGPSTNARTRSGGRPCAPRSTPGDLGVREPAPCARVWVQALGRVCRGTDGARRDGYSAVCVRGARAVYLGDGIRVRTRPGAWRRSSQV
ncbi:hypothetical protein C8Q77DRAFT_821025 [Trametes polyzona]|nr:hypothetical protein C8Q77DRAFT_821025 [Trametes polyzona]